jgi:hypothetical protein
MGYGGFGRFRNAVAEKTGDKFYEHYLLLSSADAMFFMGNERIKYFEKYDAVTRELVEQKEVTGEVANFLYQSDCGGKIDRKQAKQIYNLIKECDDNIMFGYVGRSYCAKMSDLKSIFSDGTGVKWY